jgi:hypothetical protein
MGAGSEGAGDITDFPISEFFTHHYALAADQRDGVGLVTSTRQPFDTQILFPEPRAERPGAGTLQAADLRCHDAGIRLVKFGQKLGQPPGARSAVAVHKHQLRGAGALGVQVLSGSPTIVRKIHGSHVAPTPGSIFCLPNARPIASVKSGGAPKKRIEPDHPIIGADGFTAIAGGKKAPEMIQPEPAKSESDREPLPGFIPMLPTPPPGISVVEYDPLKKNGMPPLLIVNPIPAYWTMCWAWEGSLESVR